ncbi:MAG TPA: arylsulfatase [Gammaproteobacteria bacterium]
MMRSAAIRGVAVALLAAWAGVAVAQEARPNILIIIADDLGYSDLGAYGGDIRTPNIDALAHEGILFTQFHASPVCATTRAMLLTGNNNTVAGLARMGSYGGPVIPGLYGYENTLPDRVGVLPRILQEAGYRTYLAGKWHLGESVEHSPWSAGFERSFAMKYGAGNHFDGVGIRPIEHPYFEDDTEVDWPEGEYSTDLYTNKLIEFLEADKDSNRPFFMMAAYTSPHWPLQVPERDLDLYAGRYDMGYDRLRELRFESLKHAGIIPAESRLPPRNPTIKPFADLSPVEQRREARKMELYAAMVDNLDRHVGRLLDYLRANDLFENTLIVFMSDNGAAAEDFYYQGPFVDYIQAHYDDSYERMGKRGNYVSYGPQWAQAGAAPFRLYKGYPSEGGIVAPMIIAGNGVARSRGISRAYITVMDLMPTFLELAGAQYPEDKLPMLGESARAFLAGEADAVHGDDYVTTLAYQQRAFVRQGNWKLMTLEQPFDERDFALYDLADDPGETTDLSAQHPEKRLELLQLWRRERRALGITLPEDL